MDFIYMEIFFNIFIWIIFIDDNIIRFFKGIKLNDIFFLFNIKYNTMNLFNIFNKRLYLVIYYIIITSI